MSLSKQEKRKRIHKRIRKNVKGTLSRPRLCVYRSNKNIYCQIVDDVANHTLISASSKEVTEKMAGIELAKAVGKLVADKAKSANIDACIFDRGGYLYHGRVKALAEGARENGLNI